MKFKQAFSDGLIDRFEMMQLAEQLCALHQQSKHINSLKDVQFCDGQFIFEQTISIKKKDVFLRLSALLMSVLKSTNKRLTSIFMNHYLACLNNTDCFKYLPKSKRKPCVIACGGLSGSGKSRIAREVAPILNSPLGAIVIRDDIIRKQLANVSFDTVLDNSYYSAENELLVYREMRRQAKHALAAGYTVIFDALFYDPKQRKKVEQFATQLKVPFDGFWMTAPLQTRLERVTSRKNNPSDVKTQQDLQDQLTCNTGVIWWRVIDTSASREETLAKVRHYLKKYL